MKVLGIDTSSRFLSIAVTEDKEIIREEAHLLDRKHSSLLVPKIDELLKKIRIKIDEIDAFVVGLGPGSFTGLRIAVSTVKGFGIALQKPCIGVASIDAIAFNAAQNQGLIVPIIDAKRKQVYGAIYRFEGHQAVRESGYLLMPIERLMKKIKGEAIFLGDGVGLYKEKIADINKKAVFLGEGYWYPKAGNLIKLGFNKVKVAKKPNLDKLVPLYLYPEDCQVKKS